MYESKTITESTISKTLSIIYTRTSDEITRKTQEELEEFWWFRWDHDKCSTWNIYMFFQNLKLYESVCRRWEEHHHGYENLTERVRDKYTFNKITVFEDILGGLYLQCAR